MGAALQSYTPVGSRVPPRLQTRTTPWVLLGTAAWTCKHQQRQPLSLCARCLRGASCCSQATRPLASCQCCAYDLTEHQESTLSSHTREDTPHHATPHHTPRPCPTTRCPVPALGSLGWPQSRSARQRRQSQPAARSAAPTSLHTHATRGRCCKQDVPAAL